MRTLWCARPRRVRAAGHAEELSAVLLPLFPQRISRSTWSPCACMRLDCILTGGNGGLCPGKWHAQRHRRRGMRPTSWTL